jgi:hypothetical protein
MKTLATAAALLIDGTAVYFRSREGRSEQRLDYEGLNRVLLAEAGISSFDPALFFTTYDAQNEGQAKFLTFIQTRLGWEPDPRPVWDADPLPERARWERTERNEFIRFDTSIAYALGRLLERRSKIVIVTDSFALEHPMSIAAERGQTNIVLAFFGRQLDPRWLPIVRGGNSKIGFINLDDHSEALFGREFLPSKSVSTGLARL